MAGWTPLREKQTQDTTQRKGYLQREGRHQQAKEETLREANHADTLTLNFNLQMYGNMYL